MSCVIASAVVLLVNNLFIYFSFILTVFMQIFLAEIVYADVCGCSVHFLSASVT